MLLWIVLLGLLAGGALCTVYSIWASTFDLQAVKEMPSRSAVYDMDGKLYSRLAGENRVVVPLTEVSKYFITALLAREDTRFYAHRGIDPIGILRAIGRNLTAGSAQQGASTLTQQLARNSFENIGQTKSLHRKLLEAFMSIRIEQHYKKDEILEFYVNRIYFGAGVYGIEAASSVYFNKRAKDLSLSESAMIAGIIRAPTYSSPIQHPERATKARDSVLDRMVKVKVITLKEAAAARDAKLLISKRHPLQAQENYVMDAVLRDLNLILSDDQRAQGGLKVYTTIDPVLQKSAEQAVDVQLRKVEAKTGYNHPRRSEFTSQQRDDEAPTPYLQGAAVVIDNRYGSVRALVGGRDYSESKFNRAIMGKLQVGSTIKPFVYAAAYRRGLLPGSFIDDGPIRPGEIPEAPGWTPGNSDGAYRDNLRVEDALVFSRNTSSIRVGQFATLDQVVRLAARTGIGELPKRPAIFLGAFESDLRAMTAAYSVLPNNGLRRQNYLIERIDDAAGDTLFRAAHVETNEIDPGVAWLVTNGLMKVMEKGTAATAKSLGWTKPAAGKTGTTNDYKDAWFIGYTSSLTCGVWVGFDTPKTIMSKGYGAALALPVWVDIMADASAKQYPTQPLKPAVPLQRVAICASTSGLALSGCERAGTSYTIDLPASCVPKNGCSKHSGGVLASGSGDPRGKPVVEGIFKSFKRFFGGK